MLKPLSILEFLLDRSLEIGSMDSFKGLRWTSPQQTPVDSTDPSAALPQNIRTTRVTIPLHPSAGQSPTFFFFACLLPFLHPHFPLWITDH